ncbi:MAG: hypothetical protein AAF266_13905 [Planctomycetota bacterium]
MSDPYQEPKPFPIESVLQMAFVILMVLGVITHAIAAVEGVYG